MLKKDGTGTYAELLPAFRVTQMSYQWRKQKPDSADLARHSLQDVASKHYDRKEIDQKSFDKSGFA